MVDGQPAHEVSGMITRYADCEPLSDDFADFCNAHDYTVADVQSDPKLRERLEQDFSRAKANATN